MKLDFQAIRNEIERRLAGLHPDFTFSANNIYHDNGKIYFAVRGDPATKAVSADMVHIATISGVPEGSPGKYHDRPANHPWRSKKGLQDSPEERKDGPRPRHRGS